MIQVENMTRYYGDFLAVDRINFSISKGEIIGLLGPNGAGKSTTLRILTGYLVPSSGSIKVKGLDVTEHALEVKKLIGYLPESAPLYHEMLVYDYLLYLADILNLDDKIKEKRINETAEKCGLFAVMHKSVNELSKGYKQRVGLAHALLGDPEILVLDEPTSGLDPNQILEIRDLIKQIGKEKTVILSSHILSEIEATCDRVIIINKGKIVADSPVSELKSDAISAQTFELDVTLTGAAVSEVKSAFQSISEIENIEVWEENSEVYCRLVGTSEQDVRTKIYEFIKSKSWILLNFHQKEQSLESIFHDLTTSQN